MTSNTKIGLLLGLVFVFVVAFLLNGLPHLLKHFSDGQNLTSDKISHQPPGTVDKPNKVSGRFVHPSDIQPEVVQNPIFDKEHFSAAKGLRSTSESLGPKPSEKLHQLQDGIFEAVEKVKAYQPEDNRQKQPSADSSKGMFYTIKENDTLTKLAFKFYGKQVGDQMDQIKCIFEANKDQLKSINHVRVGQEIWIPLLSGSSDFSLQTSLSKTGTPKAKVYRVKDGDTLSEIAAEVLGSAKRYLELYQLNRDRMADEDDLKAGMELRLPG